jgi:hypothetical protein
MYVPKDSNTADPFVNLIDNLIAGERLCKIDPDEDQLLAKKISDEAIARRKKMAILADARNVEFDPTSRNPKQGFRIVLARLCENPQDQVALDYVPVGLGFRDKGDTFGKSALARIFCQFGDLLSEETHQQLFEEVTTYEGFLTGGTENHIAMRRTSGFLFGERFPDAMFYHGLTGRELAEECLQYMIRYGQTLFRNSMVEYLSPVYHAVHTATWLNVVEFAKDPRAKLCARAILDWMLADLAVNYHHGIIIPPATRAKGLVKEEPMVSYNRLNTQWTGWLYWGAGTMPDTQDALERSEDWHRSPLVLHAVSNYVPEPVIRNLGAKRLTLPYALLQARASREVISQSQTNAYGLTKPVDRNSPCARYNVRSVYVHRHYALGAGARVEDIDEPTLRHAHSFAVIWRDALPHNWLFFVHPYWYVNRKQKGADALLGPEDWSGTSPFFQMVHWENAAVLLFNLPEEDPYVGQAEGDNPKWLSSRPHKIIQRAHAYIPKTMDETVTTSKGVFLRSGDVYVGIRPIGGRVFWEDGVHEGYHRLVIEGDLVGAAVEVGDCEEFASFAAFQEQVSATSLDTHLLQTENRVQYCSTRGHKLDLQYNKEDWRPIASVNDVRLDFDRWPTCESPYVTCREGVMDVNDGVSGFKVNWQGELPEYTYYDLSR